MAESGRREAWGQQVGGKKVKDFLTPEVFLSGDPHDRGRAAFADPLEGPPEDHDGGGQRMKRRVVQN